MGWKVLRLVFLKKPDTRLEKKPTRVPLDRIAERSFQVVYFGSCGVIGPHVVAEKGVYCLYMKGSLTNILQRHWEW